MSQEIKHRRVRDDGFTLVEIVIAIVAVGILAAVAVVGINAIADSSSDSACNASLDAAKAATTVYYASHGSSYPADFDDLTGGDPAALTLPEGYEIVDDGMSAKVGDWTLTMEVASEGAAPTFECA